MGKLLLTAEQIHEPAPGVRERAAVSSTLVLYFAFSGVDEAYLQQGVIHRY